MEGNEIGISVTTTGEKLKSFLNPLVVIYTLFPDYLIVIGIFMALNLSVLPSTTYHMLKELSPL